MTSDYRVTPGLIHEIADALERHGYYRGDDQHADRAIGLIGDMARIYEGTRDYPEGAYLLTVPSPLPAPPGPSSQAGHDAVTLAGPDISTALAALDDAAEYKRDRAGTCADCPDQSCLTCQTRLQGAREYDQLAARVLQAAEARAAHRGQPEPAPSLSPGRPDHAADREAGQ